MKNVIDILTNNVNGQYNTIIIVAIVITLAVMIAWYVVLMKTGEYSDTSSKVKPSDVKDKEVKAPAKEKKDVDVDKLIIQKLKRGQMFFDEKGLTTSTGLDAEELFNDLRVLVNNSDEIAKELSSLKEQELRTTNRVHHKSLSCDLDGDEVTIYVTGSMRIVMTISQIKQIKSINDLRGHIDDDFILKHDAFNVL